MLEDITASLPLTALGSSPTKHRVGLVVALFIFPLTYFLISIIYNLFFHPLRKFSGPPLAAISKVWSRIGNLHGQKSHRIHAAHARYGHVIRIAPNELSFASPDAIRDIYSSDAFVKDESFYHARRIFHEEHVMSIRNPEAHKHRRKLLQRGFSQAAMLEYEPHMTKKITALFDQWAKKSEQGKTPINVYPWVYWFSFDTVYHLMFDEDPRSVEKAEPHWVMRYMRSWRPTPAYREFVPQLEQWGTYVPGKVGDCFRDVEKWKKFAVGVIQRCRDNGTSTPVLQNALNGKDGSLGRPLTDSELAEEGMGGMFGGTGTTANTFVFLLWAVLRSPNVVVRLRRELRDTFGDGATVPSATECAKLPYLQAVINETLRRYPTIVATLPRMAIRDTVVAGASIPKGTVVGMQNYTTHRNPSAFPDAETFLPERWLDKESEALRKESFTPFSIGQRSCIGINLAKMELSKLVAAFFLRFDAEVDGSMNESEMTLFDQFSASPVGAKLVLCMREI